MFKHRKLAGLIGTALTATLAFAGCSSSGPAESTADATTLSLWVPAGTDSIAPYVKSFNSSHPGQTVTVREIPFAQYDTALGQAFSVGQGPDLAQINGTSMPTFASKGFLQPIDALVGTSGDLATDNFYPNLLKAAAYDGMQMTIPIDTGTRVLQYNKKLFEKAGIQSFGETATYEEILAAATKIRALGDDYQGFCYVGGVKEYTINSNLGPFVIQSGGSFVSADGKTATLTHTGGRPGRDLLQGPRRHRQQGEHRGYGFGPLRRGSGQGHGRHAVRRLLGHPSGDAASKDFELGQTLPMDKTTYSSTGGWVLGVPAYVKPDKTKILQAFVSDMYKPENLVKFTGLMPATKSGRDAATGLKDAKYDIYWKILNDNADNPIPLSGKLVEQGNLLTSATQSILQGTDTVEGALTKANTAFQATLS